MVTWSPLVTAKTWAQGPSHLDSTFLLLSVMRHHLLSLLSEQRSSETPQTPAWAWPPVPQPATSRLTLSCYRWKLPAMHPRGLLAILLSLAHSLIFKEHFFQLLGATYDPLLIRKERYENKYKLETGPWEARKSICTPINYLKNLLHLGAKRMWDTHDSMGWGSSWNYGFKLWMGEEAAGPSSSRQGSGSALLSL